VSTSKRLPRVYHEVVYDTTSTRCTLHSAVTMIQRPCFFVRCSQQSQWYNHRIVCVSQSTVTMIQLLYCLNVTVRRYYDTTPILLVCHSSPSLWYNAYIACTSQFTVTIIQRQFCLYVTLRRHLDKMSALFDHYYMPSL